MKKITRHILKNPIDGSLNGQAQVSRSLRSQRRKRRMLLHLKLKANHQLGLQLAMVALPMHRKEQEILSQFTLRSFLDRNPLQEMVIGNLIQAHPTMLLEMELSQL